MMMHSQENPPIDDIRSFQASLHPAIEQCTALSFSSNASKLDAYKARSQISQNAASIATLTKNPTFFGLELSLLPLTNMTIRMAIDMDIFKHINNTPNSANNENVTKATTAHPTIILRIMRLLATFHIFRESKTSSPTYYLTN